MRRSLSIVCLLVLVGSVVGACSSGDDTASPGGGGSTCKGTTLDGKALLACVGPALAYVETASSTGSGVLLAGGYVVTNAHVVDPYSAADLTFPNGTYVMDVPVVGIDPLADIAVLGPLAHPDQVDADPLAIGSGKDVAKGSDVFLLGYPGEAEDEPDPTISRGVLSRIRKVAEFDQTYLQTDASIGGGQSGGALVDEQGHLLGISGLSFAEEFALALDGADVQDAVDRIVAGHGDPYASLPDPAKATTDHTLDLVDQLDARSLVVAAADAEQAVTVSVGTDPAVTVTVYDLYGDTLVINQGGVELLKAADMIESVSDLGVDVAQPSAPGTYELKIPAHIEASIVIGSSSPSPLHVPVHTSVPSSLAQWSPRQAIELGKAVTTSFDYFEVSDAYTLDLQAGDTVHITARSPQGDVAVLVRAPGSAVDDVTLIDDGGGGLYDSDADDTFTAKATGRYGFGVFTFDGVVTGYRFTVDRS